MRTYVDDGMLRIRGIHQELRAAVAHVLLREGLSRGLRKRLRVSPSRAQRSGRVAGGGRAVAVRRAAVDGEADSTVAAADGGAGSGAHGAPLRLGVAGGRQEEEGLPTPQGYGPGGDDEVDVGESWVHIAGVPRKVKYLVTLAFSSTRTSPGRTRWSGSSRCSTASSRPSATTAAWWNASSSIVPRWPSRTCWPARDRVQTEAFEECRGAYPFRAEFCAPAQGWEKVP